jgi:hypothetical protein
MAILIGLVVFLIAIYFWLIGHWFARVMVFLVLAIAGVAAGGSAAAYYGEQWAASQTPSVIAVRKAYPPGAENETDADGVPTVEALKAKVAKMAKDLHWQQPVPPPRPSPKAPALLVVLGCGVGAVLAWPLSGIPVYYRRRQHQRDKAASLPAFGRWLDRIAAAGAKLRA